MFNDFLYQTSNKAEPEKKMSVPPGLDQGDSSEPPQTKSETDDGDDTETIILGARTPPTYFDLVAPPGSVASSLSGPEDEDEDCSVDETGSTKSVLPVNEDKDRFVDGHQSPDSSA